MLLGRRHRRRHRALDPDRARLPAARRRPRSLGAFLDSIAERRPERLCLAALRSGGGAGRAHRAHPGAAARVGGARARRHERGGVRRCGRGGAQGATDPETAAAYTQAGPLWQSYAGLVRYFAKKGKRRRGKPLPCDPDAPLGPRGPRRRARGRVPAAADAAVHTQLVGNFDTRSRCSRPGASPARRSTSSRRAGRSSAGRAEGTATSSSTSTEGSRRRRAGPSVRRHLRPEALRLLHEPGLGQPRRPLHAEQRPRARQSGSRRTILARTSRPTTTTAARCSTAAAISTSASATAAAAATRTTTRRT